MLIWIDGYEANVPQRLGSGQVAFELIKNLEAIDHDNDYLILLPGEPLVDLPKARPGWNYKILKPSLLWTRVALPLALFRAHPKPDLVFSPTHYIPRFTKIKRIVTIFDIAFLRFPEMFKKDDLWKLTNWTRYSIEASNRIITISEFSKKEILHFYPGIKDSKITVAYPGFKSELFKRQDQRQIAKVKDKYGISGDYLIFLSTLQPRKNHLRLIEAIKDVPEIKLVIVGKTKGEGKQGWMFEQILERPKQLGIEDRVIFTGFADTKDLPALYSGAKAFVQPSLWEGFGIPVVDAMACGTPVLSSNVSSLPEVVGEAGLLFDPTSVEEIKATIIKFLADPKLQRKLSTLSLKRAKLFSWQKMAEQIKEVFEAL